MTNENYMKDLVIRTQKASLRTEIVVLVMVLACGFAAWVFSREISQLKARVAALEVLVQEQE